MSTLQEGAKGYVIFDGNPLALVTSITRRTESGQQEIVTIEDSLSGFSAGGGKMTATIEYAIPISGTEDEFQAKCVQGALVDLQIGFGNKATIATGKIMSTEETHASGSPASGTFEWTGKPAEEE